MHELKRFLGILLMCGYSTVPAINDYWSSNPTLGRPIVKQALSRNKFKLIKKYLHLNDNNALDKDDKFSKLRPYFDLLNRNFIKFGVFSPHLSIDEQMVPYYGKHSCKMYIRGKPIRFGYKLWCLCSSEGYLYQFYPYAGAGGYNKQIGLGAEVVLRLLSVVEYPIRHDVYFDNFFTSYYLMCLLSERNFFATGTVRSNRLKNAVLKTGKNLPKGSTDYVFDTKNQILLTRWSDSKEVTLATNHQTIEPMARTTRYDKQQKKKVPVQIAQLIHHYNHNMGGVDLHDNAVSNYRVAIRGKKWWWTLFASGLDSALVNAWKLHCLIAKQLKQKAKSQIEFKVKVTEDLLLTSDPETEDNENQYDADEDEDRPPGLPSIRGKHLVGKDPQQKSLRCAVCHKTTVYICTKCNRHLHPKCFNQYAPHM